MTTAIYCRVSTLDKGQDTDLQSHDLKTYALSRGWLGCPEYIDQGVSGSKDSRPALDRLMNDCRKGKVKTILVWRLDRFSRSIKHLINTIDELERVGCTLVSYKENLDMGSPTGRLMVHLIAAFAEFERNIIRERVKAGLQNAKRKGVVLGNKPLTVPHDEIVRLRGQGMTIRQIANQVGCSVTPIMRVLKSTPSKSAKV